MTGGPDQPGALVISLDFELHWGVRDHTMAAAEYRANLLGARRVIPRLLEMFEEYEVRATWATVGFLFAGSKAELDRFRPPVLPTYDVRSLFPYDEPVGADEAADPLHFARSLVAAIAGSPGQEVATHTYSHYFCAEPGQTSEQFAVDLDSAVAIAASQGLSLRSIVFPRNQHQPAYDDILRGRGITVYRGNPDSWMWRFETAGESATRGKRLARLLDTYLPISGDGSFAWVDVPKGDGLMDVRASFFVRPYAPRLRSLEGLRGRRLRHALRSAARRKRIVHLWWHPHNFGRHPDECLRILRTVLDEYARLRDEFGMISLSMADVADRMIGSAERAGFGSDESMRHSR
jgi:peptidoglycan/xylan/chitin deacetylase (PgdA/CDA1 family)